jgi:hypothetical protein
MDVAAKCGIRLTVPLHSAAEEIGCDDIEPAVSGGGYPRLLARVTKQAIKP